jgi:hypothetical protein
MRFEITYQSNGSKSTATVWGFENANNGRRAVELWLALRGWHATVKRLRKA